MDGESPEENGGEYQAENSVDPDKNQKTNLEIIQKNMQLLFHKKWKPSRRKWENGEDSEDNGEEYPEKNEEDPEDNLEGVPHSGRGADQNDVLILIMLMRCFIFGLVLAE